MPNDFATFISDDLNLPHKSINATIKLLDNGATIPFISRYRKEATGMLDEVAVHKIAVKYDAYKALARRKETILETLKEKGCLTPELSQRIESTHDVATLEDIYLPYKPKRRTRAQIAIEQGLEPLAKLIMAQKVGENDKTVVRLAKSSRAANQQEAIGGACDIIAEWISESEKARALVRSRFVRSAIISSKVAPGKETEGVNFSNYFNFSAPLRLCTSHRLLAVLRGESEGILKVSLSIDDDEMIMRLNRMFIRPDCSNFCRHLLADTVKDSYRRLIKPSIATEALTLAKAKADDAAIALFADNARQLLLASPLGQKRVMAIDPGFRTGCKVVCLDEQGSLIYHDVIFPNAPISDFHSSAFKLSNIISDFSIEVIAVGNGTASRETEKFLSQLRLNIPVISVNESGASIYSASEIARREFPNEDITVRGAVSIGRRLIDPLAELVKIDPKSIGVGQYQHDVDQSKLKESLTYTVESCVNTVGVNVNTASRELLSYVSGIGPTLAANIITYRNENGPFMSRKQLQKVPRMGEKAYQQSAGFLRIPDSKNILDNTAVHPERYELVETIAADNGVSVDRLVRNHAMLQKIDLRPYVTKEIGMPTLTDIILELDKPGRDPRLTKQEEENAPVFDQRIKSISDLQPGMELTGIVNNITAFGCFVDIGIHENGLVHISQLTDRYVSNPADIVRINQRVNVKVIDIDSGRGRIALTMKGIPQP
ncbi:MAG: RNA-binding transcriptional accessory protein [Muribaculum sp.]|nr:RNA-binding transcriptional accessory protein [Muribaculaceae bacterium]MCM1080363.1 RNA-binding transcriptional accessory protein [Muribaculum sp.]